MSAEVSRAEKLASEGEFAEATSALDKLRERFGGEAWFGERGEGVVAAARKRVARLRLRRANDALAKARKALEGGKLAAARGAVSGNADWPEEVRDAAAPVLTRLAAAEAEAGAKRKRDEAWKGFVAALGAAGREGVDKAREVIRRERPSLRSAGLAGDRLKALSRMESLVRQAALVDELAGMKLKAAGRPVKLRWGGTEVSGKVLSMADGLLKVRTLRGEHVAVPLGEVNALDMVEMSGLAKAEGRDRLRAAAYLALRGDYDAARKSMAKATGKEASALRGDIDEIERLSPPPGPPAATSRPARTAAATPRPIRDVLTGLVARWTFDERSGSTARDSSGRGNDGEIRGAKWAAGKAGGALAFDGSGNYVRAGTKGFNAHTGTVAAWARREGGDGARYVFSARQEKSDTRMCLNSIDGRFVVGIGDVKEIESGKGFGSGWAHVAMTWDRGSCRLYVDGAKVGEGAYGDFSQVGDHCTIGAFRDEDKEYWHGAIDEVRVYDRALAAREIAAVFRSTGSTGSGGGGGAGRVAAAKVTVKGLVGHWTFDEGGGATARDSSGKRTHSSVKGAKWTQGKSGRALVFDGKDDCVETPAFTNPTRAITVACWAKSGTANWNSSGMLVCKRDAFILHPLGGGKQLSFYVHQGGWPCAAFAVTGDITQWRHYAGSYDSATGTIGLYVDGRLVATKQASGKLAADTGSMFIGRDEQNGRWFDGAIDDVRIYDRALPASEVAALSGGEAGGGAVAGPAPPSRPAGRSAPVGLSTGLVGRWRLDAGRGDAVRDSSGKGKHGKLKGPKRAAGRTIRALSFDGKDDYVEFPGGVHDFSKAFSVSMRARFEELRGRRCLIGKSKDGNDFAFVLVTENDRLKLAVKKKKSQSTSKPHPTKLAKAKWYHISAAMDGGSTVTLYVNGVASPKMKMSNRNNSGSLRIGRARDKYWGCVKGVIDDIRVYSRPITPDEVAKLAGPLATRLAARSTPSGSAKSGKPPVALPGRAAGGGGSPQGNLVPNGGFEEMGDDNFAAGWHRWMEGGRQASVRTDRADAHAGKNSLSAKVLADGVTAGAWCTLSDAGSMALPPGVYEARFWACSEATGTSVGLTVAGLELTAVTIGEDWKQVKKRITFAEKKVRPSLRIYAVSPKVKVWFDDVELVFVKGP